MWDKRDKRGREEERDNEWKKRVKERENEWKKRVREKEWVKEKSEEERERDIENVCRREKERYREYMGRRGR